MSEAKRTPLELRQMRRRAHRTQAELANDLGSSVVLIINLERDHGNPRLSTVFQLCLVLARYLGASPRVILDELLSEKLYDEFTDIRVLAAHKLDTTEDHPNSLWAKQKFLGRGVAPRELETPLSCVSYDKFQNLYASSQFSQAEIARLTGLSERRLNHIFAVGASRSGNMSLLAFMRLAAVLSPIHGAGIKETTFYLVSRELDALTRIYEDEQQTR